jgi:hypothetical protein
MGAVKMPQHCGARFRYVLIAGNNVRDAGQLRP